MFLEEHPFLEGGGLLVCDFFQSNHSDKCPFLYSSISSKHPGAESVVRHERRWTIIALRNLIFYFWSNIELTWHEYSFMPQITNYKEKIMGKNFWNLF